MARIYTRRGTPADERFWGRVPVRGTGCWLWGGRLNSNGYGMFKLGGQGMNASRAAYMLSHGPFADGLHVLHRCDNRACVNPAHLFLGTHQDNMHDAAQKQRMRGGRGRKLSLDQRADIKRRRSSESLSQLAAAFGVSRTAILKVAGKRSPIP